MKKLFVLLALLCAPLMYSDESEAAANWFAGIMMCPHNTCAHDHFAMVNRAREFAMQAAGCTGGSLCQIGIHHRVTVHVTAFNPSGATWDVVFVVSDVSGNPYLIMEKVLGNCSINHGQNPPNQTD